MCYLLCLYWLFRHFGKCSFLKNGTTIDLDHLLIKLLFTNFSDTDTVISFSKCTRF